MSEARYEPQASGRGPQLGPSRAELTQKTTQKMTLDLWIQRVTTATLVALAAGLLATGIAFYLP